MKGYLMILGFATKTPLYDQYESFKTSIEILLKDYGIITYDESAKKASNSKFDRANFDRAFNTNHQLKPYADSIFTWLSSNGTPTVSYELIRSYLKEIGFVNADDTVNAGGYRIKHPQLQPYRRDMEDWLINVGIRGEKITEESMNQYVSLPTAAYIDFNSLDKGFKWVMLA